MDIEDWSYWKKQILRLGVIGKKTDIEAWGYRGGFSYFIVKMQAFVCIIDGFGGVLEEISHFIFQIFLGGYEAFCDVFCAAVGVFVFVEVL